MIGVQTKPDEREIAAEFFELFKTPWEFARPGQRYDVLLNTSDDHNGPEAALILRYRAEAYASDAANNIRPKPCQPGSKFRLAGRTVPLYGPACAFPRGPFSLTIEGDEQSSIASVTRNDGRTTVRLGYNLFAEIRHLLTTGQPVANAATPTLDLHIALLREIITRAGLPIVEIPPVPQGYKLTACLTHDVDHPVLKNHFLDHTMFGFLGRSTVGSLMDVVRGRKNLGTFGRNCWAACKLPFVYLGLARDPWRGFDRYLKMASEPSSTFFVIPRKGDAGRQRAGNAPARRAAGYSLDDIRPELDRACSSGGEVALHGLDAWLEAADGKYEHETLSSVNSNASRGVRMHWLYFDGQSPKALDEAGFTYDSTVGYNETVGFRAGTAIVFRPPGTAKLLELPLHVMDTALFYPTYLNLRDDEARKLVRHVVEDVAAFGGALTINWHDRSIAPERLWGEFYLGLVRELEQMSAWMPTASKAVSWFEKRRSVKFTNVRFDGESYRFRATASIDEATPGLVVRIHRPQVNGLFDQTPVKISADYKDSVLNTETETSLSIAA